MANKIAQNELSLLDKSILTPQIKWLETIIGITQTYRFLNAFGGQRIELPKHVVKYNHPLALVLGIDDANRLCHAWAQLHRYDSSLKFDIPAFDTILLAIRKATICNLAINHTYNEISKQTGMTYRYIKRFVNCHCVDCDQNIASKATKIDNTPDLFNQLFELKDKK